MAARWRQHKLTLRARHVLGITWLAALYGVNLILLITLAASLPPYRFRTAMHHPPTIIYASDSTVLAKFTDKYRIPISLSQVPPHTVHAVLAAEDARFFQHRGLDGRGIARAAWVNLRRGRFVQGGSTLTQQLVRLELLDDRRTLRRKWREVVLALRVERAYTKSEILERYLNTVYFGSGAYGIEAAARSYYDKPAAQLTPAESAILAGLIRAPSEGNPRNNRPLALRRQQQVLAAMHKHDWLSDASYQQAMNEQIDIAPKRTRGTPWRAPYAVEMVRLELLKRYGRETVYHGGLVVYTTIDGAMQDAAEQAMRQAWANGRGRNVGSGALVALDPRTGDIKAMVGGPDFWRTPFNRATQAHRQPGSAFKAFVYLAAIQEGHLLTDYTLDAPITIGKWSPKNYSGAYHGRVMLQQALALSLNSVAVRLTMEIGPGKVMRAARDTGISSRLGSDLSMALGAYEVTPLEMTRAFATLANGGKLVDPRLIKEIRQQERVLHSTQATGRQRIESADAFILTQGLTQVITAGTGRRAMIGRPAAGKTGTSNRHRDAWFVGYTPHLCAAVWMGNDNRAPMAGVAGGSLPAPAWAAFMRAALVREAPTNFPVPPDVVMVPIDPRTGALARPGVHNPIYTYVAKDRVPMTPPPAPDPYVHTPSPRIQRDPFVMPPEESQSPELELDTPPSSTPQREREEIPEPQPVSPSPEEPRTAPPLPDAAQPQTPSHPRPPVAPPSEPAPAPPAAPAPKPADPYAKPLPNPETPAPPPLSEEPE